MNALSRWNGKDKIELNLFQRKSDIPEIIFARISPD